jgi:hypothetical protein
MAVVPHPPYLPDLAPCYFSVSRHYDAIEVIMAESQTVLNILTERDFQHGFKKVQKLWERLIRPDGDCFKGDVGQYGSTSPGNYGYACCICPTQAIVLSGPRRRWDCSFQTPFVVWLFARVLFCVVQ